MADLTRAFRVPVGAMEAGASLLSGAVAEPVAGWAGILSGGNADKVAATREALTYSPRTDAGKESMAGIADIMGAIKDAAMRSPIGTAVNGFNAMADRAGAVSPALGAAVKTVPAAAAMLLGPGGTATRQAVANVARGTGQGVARGVAAAAENAAAVPAVRGPLANQDGIFAGHLAKNAPTWKLEQAKTLEARGLSDREIYAQTGWFKGMPDGQWRFEIPDNEAKFNTSGVSPNLVENDIPVMSALEVPAGDLLKHPHLMEAYPDLGRMPTQIKPALDGTKGAYNPEADEMTLFTPVRAQDGKSTMLHELQHAVQEREGFAPGGSPEGLMKSITEEVEAKIVALDDAAAEALRLGDFGKYAELMDEANALRRQPRTDAQEAYRRLAGEAEARLTQARQHMTPEERAASYPLDMLDVPVDQLILRPR